MKKCQLRVLRDFKCLSEESSDFSAEQSSTRPKAQSDSSRKRDSPQKSHFAENKVTATEQAVLTGGADPVAELLQCDFYRKVERDTYDLISLHETVPLTGDRFARSVSFDSTFFSYSFWGDFVFE